MRSRLRGDVLIRALYLQPARERTVAALPDLTALDDELARYVGSARLKVVARYGLRGEVFYPVPLLLTANPQLLGYYRLLYGVSQEEFYNCRDAPFRPFVAMEERGVVPRQRENDLPDLCRSLIETGALLIKGLGRLDTVTVHELQLLTVGPQFRGSRNTDLGTAAVGLVFNLIKSVIAPNYIESVTDQEIRLVNSADRTVRIRFSADPGIAISEITGKTDRKRVSIEVDGGTDVSNRLNRLGEAEKSHVKARKKGFTEFWTIAAVGASWDEVKANSPTTTTFFALLDIAEVDAPRHEEFKEQLGSVLGIAI